MGYERNSLGPTFTGTVAAVGTFMNSVGDELGFIISGLSTETIAVSVSVDTVNFSAPVKPIDTATGVAAAAAALPNGCYIMDVKPWAAIKFTKSAAVESVTIRMASGY